MERLTYGGGINPPLQTERAERDALRGEVGWTGWSRIPRYRDREPVLRAPARCRRYEILTSAPTEIVGAGRELQASRLKASGQKKRRGDKPRATVETRRGRGRGGGGCAWRCGRGRGGGRICGRSECRDQSARGARRGRRISSRRAGAPRIRWPAKRCAIP